MKRYTLSASRPRAGGFTLIELSIVMVILGLIIAGGLGIYGPSMRQVVKEKNEVVIQDAVKALVGFAGAHKALPDTTTTPLTAVLRSPRDAQNNELEYAYDSNLIAASSVCNRDTTNLTVQVMSDATTTKYTATNVAFVIWSMGHDGARATGSGKSAGAKSTSTNYKIPLYAADGATAGSSEDDLVGWATLSELKAAAGCGGSSLKILADSLPAGIVGSAYNSGTAINFTADGGVATYSWCVEFPSAIRSKLTFAANPSTTPVTVSPVTTFGGCSGGTYVGTENKLTMTGSTVFASADQGGPYDFVVYLKDSNANAPTITRRFSLYVNQ